MSKRRPQCLLEEHHRKKTPSRTAPVLSIDSVERFPC